MGYDMYWVDRAGNDREHYFRLNIGGMGVAAGLMAERGMLYDDRARPTSDEWATLPEWDDASEDGGPAYVEAHRLLVSRVGEGANIPVHKIYGTNDGWVVTPAEITGAMEAYARWLGEQGIAEADDEPTTWWPEWIAWMRAAGGHNGFEVR